MELETGKLDSEEVMRTEIETMNAFGCRTTGSQGHLRFVTWLKEQLTNMGLEVHSDTYTFKRWEEKRSALLIHQEEVHVSSAYPYSGETDEVGITGELVHVQHGSYNKASGKIAVVEINTVKKLPLGLIMNKRSAVPSGTNVVAGDGDLVLTSVLKNPHLKRAKEKGVKAVILVWKGVADEKVEKQYLPFTDDYMGIPAIWVNVTDGKRVIEAAKRHEQATVILEAEKQESATTESFYVTIERKKTDETIIINTHTDGINVIEENGAIGLLSMIRYLQNRKPERTLVFAFITGHFRLPVFKGSSQATSTWLMGNPKLWDGKIGSKKAVAGITVEHLGSMEWKESVDGRYKATGNIQTEYTYAGNEQMEAIWKEAMKGRSLSRTVILRGHNKFEFGESQPLFEAGIPVIGLIQMPDYLMLNSQDLDKDMDKFNVCLMRQQVESLLKAVIQVDETPTVQLGIADKYSFLYGKTR